MNVSFVFPHTQQESHHHSQIRCSRCGAAEGQSHPTRGMQVTLEATEPGGPGVCQICRLHEKLARLKPGPGARGKILKPKSFSAWLFLGFAVILVLILSSLTLAQPPGLPPTPSQAPIDGGLSLLAAAGGAYAYKKLRNKKENI